MTEVRGLQLARNDKAAASGLMTEARQDRSLVAVAPSGAYGKHFTLAPFPARNPPNVRLKRSGVPTVRSAEAECLSTPSVCHETEGGASSPASRHGASAPERGEGRPAGNAHGVTGGSQPHEILGTLSHDCLDFAGGTKGSSSCRSLRQNRGNQSGHLLDATPASLCGCSDAVCAHTRACR